MRLFGFSRPTYHTPPDRAPGRRTLPAIGRSQGTSTRYAHPGTPPLGRFLVGGRPQSSIPPDGIGCMLSIFHLSLFIFILFSDCLPELSSQIDSRGLHDYRTPRGERQRIASTLRQILRQRAGFPLLRLRGTKAFSYRVHECPGATEPPTHVEPKAKRPGSPSSNKDHLPGAKEEVKRVTRNELSGSSGIGYSLSPTVFHADVSGKCFTSKHILTKIASLFTG
jgi:hypothetical protein